MRTSAVVIGAPQPAAASSGGPLPVRCRVRRVGRHVGEEHAEVGVHALQVAAQDLAPGLGVLRPIAW